MFGIILTTIASGILILDNLNTKKNIKIEFSLNYFL